MTLIAIVKRLNQLAGLIAQKTPSGIARKIMISDARKVSSRVAGSFFRITVKAGSLKKYELPKSPCSARHTNLKY